ncbi:AhpA/YtjB family protein [Psychromonas sp. CD1]|uniref:AhpA/YtjB family protein n=1 Tax=Psychromonas sp. CD1 TaxID=1979839 RepID=UPI000B9AB3FB|nr:AhpA/YtjB family protein [Psychromonas sp. CD1]
MHKNMHFLLRSLQLLGLFVILLTLVYQLIVLRNSANILRQQQTEKFSFSLTNLAGAEATRYLLENKNKELKLLIDNLSNDPMVRDATLYNQFGKVLFQSNQSLSLDSLLNLNTKDKITNEGLIPYVIELHNNQKSLGYLRITLEQNKILTLFHSYQETSFKILICLLCLAFFAGTIIMALFFNQVVSRYSRIQNGIQKLISSNQFL